MTLSETQSDGKSLKEHLLNVQKQLGFVPKELQNLKELPLQFKYVWEDFLMLSSSRPAGFGISPISFSEIKAYADLNGFEFEPWEVQVIKLFDNKALSHYSKQQAKKTK